MQSQLAIVEMINGGYYPEDGIHSIPKAIYKLCLEMGVQFVFNTKIDEIKYERQSFNISSGAKSYKRSTDKQVISLKVKLFFNLMKFI